MSSPLFFPRLAGFIVRRGRLVASRPLRLLCSKMKKVLILLLLFTEPLYAEVYGPEPNWEYHVRDDPPKTFDQKRDVQLWLFWTLNVLDAYTTDRAIRKCADCREINPLLPSRPSLEQIIAYKAVFGGVVHRYGSRRFLNVINTILGGAIVHNYNLTN